MKTAIWSRIFLFFAFVGPGLITSVADNDAGGIATYSVAGAQEKYGLLWLLFLCFFVLAVVQEMSCRLGVVTGKGLADLIRERFGIRWTAIIMLLLVLSNLTVTMSEFAGVAASFELLGTSKYVSVPLVGFIVWILVIKGSYRSVERTLLFFCLVYVTYIISGVLANPDFLEVGKSLVTPTFKMNSHFINLFIAAFGTTITPWMQFYLQSSVVDKKVKIEQYKYARIEVYIGAFITVLIGGFIIIAAAAALHGKIDPTKIATAKDAALALRPIAGKYCFYLFSIGLMNASIIGVFILPLCTAYAISEAFGWESGVGKSFRDAPQFHVLYMSIIGLSILLVLYPHINLMSIMILSQTVNGMLLPFILIAMLVLINDPETMGAYKNSRIQNIICYFTVIGMISVTILLILTTIFPKLF